MLVTFGIVDFFNVDNEYSKYKSPTNQFVKLQTNTLPPFVMLSSGTASTATMELQDINADNYHSSLAVTISDNEDIKQIKYLGQELTLKECGYYRFKITHGFDLYYSEWFEWCDVSEDDNGLYEFIQINADPYSLLVNNKYTIDLTSTPILFYANVAKSMNERIPSQLKSETVEDGISKNYGDELLKTTVNFDHDIEIIGNQSTYRLIGLLRPSCINRDVSIQYKSRVKYVRDTAVEVGESIDFGERMSLKLSFREVDFFSNNAE